MQPAEREREREREPETGVGTDLISDAGPGHTDNGIMQLAHLVSFLFINLVLALSGAQEMQMSVPSFIHLSV